jgi:hypothetical protein
MKKDKRKMKDDVTLKNIDEETTCVKDVIFVYIRERVPGKGRQKVGVIVGLVHKGVICTGFSKANLKEGDHFDKDLGIEIASDRARGGVLHGNPEIPIQLVVPMREMQMRCLRYFKQADLLSTKGAYPKIMETVSVKRPVVCDRKNHNKKSINLKRFFKSKNISSDSWQYCNKGIL